MHEIIISLFVSYLITGLFIGIRYWKLTNRAYVAYKQKQERIKTRQQRFNFDYHQELLKELDEQYSNVSYIVESGPLRFFAHFLFAWPLYVAK